MESSIDKCKFLFDLRVLVYYNYYV